MEVRVAAAGDLQAVTVTMTEAFTNDPVWSWAFPDPAKLEVWWRFWVAGAVPQGGVFVSEPEFSLPGDHAVVTTMWRDAR